MEDTRLLTRLQRGERAAFEDLWQRWRGAVWSVCVAMCAERSDAVALLQAVYGSLPRSVPGWAAPTPLCCHLGAHVFRVVHAQLELSPVVGIDVPTAGAVRVPDAATARDVLLRVEPHVRLVYLIDLFFHCPAPTLAQLLELDANDLRHARGMAAWRVIEGGAQ